MSYNYNPEYEIMMIKETYEKQIRELKEDKQ